MRTADALYLALIAILSLIDYFVLWPRFLRRSHGDPEGARRLLWSGWIIQLWTMVAAGVALWLFESRAWGTLRLVPPHGWRLWGAVALLLALAIHDARTMALIARSTRRLRIKMAHSNVALLTPRTRTDLVWWLAVSLSAGFCEEFVFRGYLLWAFQPVLGLWGAAALSVVAFGCAHAYQGAKGILATGIVGSVLTLVVLTCGSLWPAIALHALIDIDQGLMAWVLSRQQERTGKVATVGELAS